MPNDHLARTFRGQSCLVTGGAGFIGSNLTRALLDAGARVTVLDSFATGKREHLPASPSLEVVEGDVRSFAPLPELAAGASYVFHLAAQVGNVKSIAETESDASTNVLGTLRLLRLCRGTAVRKIVYSSSSAIFGEAERLPIDEDHPRRPASFYALSKMTGESYAALAAELWGLPAVSLRYFNVFGLPMEDNEYTGVISIFFNRLAAGQDLVIYGDGEQLRDFVHVSDVVAANLLAAERGEPGRVYNVGSGQGTTVIELARAMRDVTGIDAEVRFAPARAGEVRRSLADVGRARAELGYAPERSLREGLAQMWSRRGEADAGEPELSIIVPAYNEAGNLPLVCDRLLEVLSREALAAEILLVDDASADGTYAVACEQSRRSPRIRALTKPPPRGMGNAIRYGLERARAPIVAVTMGDGSDEVARIPEMLRQVRDGGASLAIGSRYRHRRNYATVPRLYRFWSFWFRLAARLLTGLKLSDYTNSFRVYRRDAFRLEGLQSGGFEISPETTFKAWFATRRVTEVDVRHLKRSAGQSSFSFLRAGPGYGIILVKAFVNRLTGKWLTLDW